MISEIKVGIKMDIILDGDNSEKSEIEFIAAASN